MKKETRLDDVNNVYYIYYTKQIQFYTQKTRMVDLANHVSSTPIPNPSSDSDIPPPSEVCLSAGCEMCDTMINKKYM